jgi:hypothetical protein
MPVFADSFPATVIIRYDALTLAMYRELAAHLLAVEGTHVELQWNQSRHFHYQDSQIGTLILQISDQTDQELIQRILDYYGSWHQETMSESMAHN